MVRLDCSGISFGSPLDEKHLFEWAAEIPDFLRWEQDTLVVLASPSEGSLREMLALFHRYGVAMGQLAQFLSPANEHWFKASTTYWHSRVFGADGSNFSTQ